MPSDSRSSTIMEASTTTMLVNLTPHPIDFFRQGAQPNDPSMNERSITLYPSTLYKPIRLPEQTDLYDTVTLTTYDTVPDAVFSIDVPIITVTYASVILPVEAPGTYNIVPRLVADIFKSQRSDLVFPYRLLREQGTRKVLGATVLGRFVPASVPPLGQQS